MQKYTKKKKSYRLIKQLTAVEANLLLNSKVYFPSSNYYPLNTNNLREVWIT